MRILFLDFDGVLVKRGRHSADAECVRQLNRITDTTGAQIVVSSSWRHFYDTMDELRTLLAQWGIRGTVISKTPRALEVDATRGDEIGEWIAKHGSDFDFVVLDDDGDIFSHHERHVKTAYDDCLTKEHADRALALFGFPVAVDADSFSATENATTRTAF